MAELRQDSVAWVFVSHSSRDVEKVRRVRDAIESRGGRPLLFFLKCMDDEDELAALLHREIEARNFFLLCDSRNARGARWVQDEIKHVESLRGRRIESIDLDGKWEPQLERVLRLLQGATVFMSYAHADLEVVEPVKRILADHDFAVWSPDSDLGPGDDWMQSIQVALTRAAREGFVLFFLSRSWTMSQWTRAELRQALSENPAARIIPVLLESSRELVEDLPATLRERQWLDFSHRDPDRLRPELLRALGMGSREA